MKGGNGQIQIFKSFDVDRDNRRKWCRGDKTEENGGTEGETGGNSGKENGAAWRRGEIHEKFREDIERQIVTVGRIMES